MTRALTALVAVDGVWYQPGTVPPPEVAEKITNPKAWGEVVQVAVVEESPVTPDAPAAGGVDLDDAVPVTPAGAASGFDPSGHTVAEVRDYIKAYPAEKDRVLDAERAGKARTALVG